MKDWKERIQDLKCVKGAIYFGSYKNPCDCGDVGCVNQATFEDNMKELKDFISKTISQEREKIIEEFKKQIEDIDCCCEEGCTASIEFKDELLHLIQK